MNDDISKYSCNSIRSAFVVEIDINDHLKWPHICLKLHYNIHYRVL